MNQSDVPIPIFLVDDEPDHLALLSASLRGCVENETIHPTLTIRTFTDPSDALTNLPADGLAGIVCDYRMPEGSALDWLPDFLKTDVGPVLVLTSHGDEQIAAQAFKAGASDYLVKSIMIEHPRLLYQAIHSALRRYKLERRNRDLTNQLKLANAGLERNNRKLSDLYETAQRFVDNVSHEFRTPLTVIKGYAEAISEGLAGDPVTDGQAKFLDIILDRTNDLAQMVDDLLDSSKLRVGALRVDRRAVKVDSILARVRPVLTRTAESHQIRWTEQIDADLPEVFVDTAKVERVVVNLVANAVKFSPIGGEVRLRARRADDGGVEIGVTDHGPGISPENLDLIFHRFRQVGTPPAAKGFGLGLNIARELAELNLGQIHVESTLGSGSTFRLNLPPCDPAAILERYLKYLHGLEGIEPVMALLRVPGGVKAHDLVIAAVRPADLVLNASDADHLVLGCTEDAGEWAGHLAEAVGTPIEIVGAWPYPQQRDAASTATLLEMTRGADHA